MVYLKNVFMLVREKQNNNVDSNDSKNSIKKYVIRIKYICLMKYFILGLLAVFFRTLPAFFHELTFINCLLSFKK